MLQDVSCGWVWQVGVACTLGLCSKSVELCVVEYSLLVLQWVPQVSQSTGHTALPASGFSPYIIQCWFCDA